MRTILNILWNVPGLGFVAAFFWALAGCLMALTVIGLPWAKACFTLANYTLAPFGREVVSRRDATGRYSLGTGGWGLVANLIWFLLVGSWLTLIHVLMACACCDHHHRHPVRMGASQARRLLDRSGGQGGRAERGGGRDRSREGGELAVRGAAIGLAQVLTAWPRLHKTPGPSQQAGSRRNRPPRRYLAHLRCVVRNRR